MASTNGGIQNEFLEKAHLKAHACREVCLTTKFDFWRLFDNILMSFVIFDQSRTMETDNNMPRRKINLNVYWSKMDDEILITHE